MLEFLYNTLARLRSDEEGQTMVEYALVLALMVVIIAAAFTATGIGGAISGAIADVIAAFPNP